MRPLALLSLIRRYLPAEIVGTVTMLSTCLLVARWDDRVITMAIVAIVAESVGFYGVIGLGIAREQRSVKRTLLLLCAEFGPAEIVDTVTRGPLMALAVVGLGPNWWGLLAGKVAADLVFYGCAWSAYCVTRARGWRTRSSVSDDLRLRREREARDLLTRPEVLHALGEQGTPLLVLDPDVVRHQYRRLQDALPYVRFHYALKALAHPAVVSAIDAEDGWFDVASAAELDLLRDLGIDTSRVIHTHPVKSERAIAEAAGAGVSTFVVDSVDELRKFAALDVGVRVLIRLAYRNPGASIDLSSKFGVDHDEAVRLVRIASTMGVPVAGFSFHVGSQLDAVEPFRHAVAATLDLMDRLELEEGCAFSVLDFGGGFPVDYRTETVTIEQVCAALDPLLRPRANRLEILAEPGRVVVADAMSLISGVVGVADRGGKRWVHLDDGVYGSWSNLVFEGIEPMLLNSPDLAEETRRRLPSTLAGPTCDSIDVLGRDLDLPELRPGDLVVSPAMGAYSIVTATEFNGLSAAPVLVLGASHASAEHARLLAVVTG